MSVLCLLDFELDPTKTTILEGYAGKTKALVQDPFAPKPLPKKSMSLACTEAIIGPLIQALSAAGQTNCTALMNNGSPTPTDKCACYDHVDVATATANFDCKWDSGDATTMKQDWQVCDDAKPCNC